MLLEFPIPFIAPGFYEMDLSEVPVLIGSFIAGPVGRSYNGSGQNYSLR